MGYFIYDAYKTGGSGEFYGDYVDGSNLMWVTENHQYNNHTYTLILNYSIPSDKFYLGARIDGELIREVIM